MRRLLLTASVALALSGCAGSGGTPAAGPTSVAAVPDVPHVRGPVQVRLQPALSLVGTESCDPAPGLLCVDSHGYRALGAARSATVRAVTTAPNAEHTAWDTVVRFAPGSRAATRARDDAAGMGGVVVVTTRDGTALVAVPPPDLDARRARLLGLEKSEAWSLVERFSRSTTGM